MEENLLLWEKLKTVPQEAQKKIGAGRLKGMTDISPQWRYSKMTEVFGPIGIGWKFNIEKQWIEEGSDGQKCAMTNISLFIKHNGEWSEAIVGTGGSMLIAKESRGPYTSDEAFKMSLTDALSVAMKMLGVGALVYSGFNDFTPRREIEIEYISESQVMGIESLLSETKTDTKNFLEFMSIQGKMLIENVAQIPATGFDFAVKSLEAKRGK